MQHPQSHSDHDDAIDTADIQASDVISPQQHAVLIKIGHGHGNDESDSKNKSNGNGASFESLSSQYQLLEKLLDRPWFVRKILNNPRNNFTTVSPVSKLCGISCLQIYYRKDDQNNNANTDKNSNTISDPKKKRSKLQPRKRVRRSVPSLEQQQQRQQRGMNHKNQKHRRSINALATMLTFDPNTGLYGRLIRGNAYVVVGGCFCCDSDKEEGPKTNKDIDALDASSQVKILKDILELIVRYKTIYHQWGADFSQDGRTQLLQACAELKTNNCNRDRKNDRIITKEPKEGYQLQQPPKEPQYQAESPTPRQTLTPVQAKKVEKHRVSSVVDDESKSFNTAFVTLSSSTNKKIATSPELVTVPPSQSSDLKRPEHNRYNLDDDLVDGATTSTSTTNNNKDHDDVLHQSSTFDTNDSSSHYSVVVESFEQKADDILESFEDEIHTLFPTIRFHHDQDGQCDHHCAQQRHHELQDSVAVSELSMGSARADRVRNRIRNRVHDRNHVPVGAIPAAFTEEANNGVMVHPKVVQDVVKEGSATRNYNHGTNISSSDDDLIQQHEREREHHTNHIDTARKIVTTDANDIDKYSMRGDENMLFMRSESLYPDSHLDSVYGIVNPNTQQGNNDSTDLTRRIENLHHEPLKWKTNATATTNASEKAASLFDRKDRNHQKMVKAAASKETTTRPHNFNTLPSPFVASAEMQLQMPRPTDEQKVPGQQRRTERKIAEEKDKEKEQQPLVPIPSFPPIVVRRLESI